MATEKRTSRPNRLQVWRRHWRLAWREAWQLLREAPVETLLTILVMALATLPVAALWLASLQLQGLTLNTQGDWMIFLKPDAGEQTAQAMAKQLRKEPAVADVEVRAPQTVLEQYLQEGKTDSDLMQWAGELFPWVLEVRAQPKLAASEGEALAQNWQQRWPDSIEQIAHDPVWQALRLHLSSLLLRLLSWVAVFSALALFFVISNTLHLRLRRHQAAIDVMRVMGAGDAYLRRPYLLASLMTGLLAGGVTLALLAAVMLSLQTHWLGLQHMLGLPLEQSRTPWVTLLLLPILLALLTVVSARISLHNLRRV